MYFKETGQEHGAASCRSGNESSSNIKCGEFIDYLRKLLAFQEDSVPMR